jgi:hypothetical protein
LNGYLLPTPKVEWECTWWLNEGFFDGRPEGWVISREDKCAAQSTPEISEWYGPPGSTPGARVHEKFARILGIGDATLAEVGEGPIEFDRTKFSTLGRETKPPTDEEFAEVVKCGVLVTSDDCHNNYCFTVDDGGLIEYINSLPYVWRPGLKGFQTQFYLQQFDDRATKGSQGVLLFYKLIKDVFEDYVHRGAYAAHFHKDIELKEAHLFVNGVDYFEDTVEAIRALYKANLEIEERTDNNIIGFMVMM